MPKEPQKVNAYKSECEECGAEWVSVVFYAPAFKDFKPLCPFCGTANETSK